MTEDLQHYGMRVSAHHDSRYYCAEEVLSLKLTPYNAPQEIVEELILELGENYKEKFWGADYDKNFPEVKELFNLGIGK